MDCQVPYEHEFVSDGCQRLRAAKYYAVQMEVEREYAQQLAMASWWRRLMLQYEIRSEIERRLDKIAPRDALYLHAR